MNFFGHSTVAYWFDRDPHFLLGAMLPDLAAMLRLRPPSSALPAITRGIAMHHATDAAFHGAPSFVALAREARQGLLERGLARGPARALAHVGTEIVLDESLGLDPEVESSYLHALDAAEGAPLHWARPEHALALRDLARNLRARGIPRSPEPTLLARRLYRVLEFHPRLAFPPADEPRVADWVRAFRPVVAAAADAVTGELRRQLEESLRHSPQPAWLRSV